MLHQGGFERVCIETARVLGDRYNVTIVIFSDKDIHYDVSGLKVINLDVPSEDGKLNKIKNVFRRVIKLRKLKEELQADLTYSFGSSANFVNAICRGRGKTVTGLRSSIDVEAVREIKLFIRRSDAVLSCSKDIVRILDRDYGYHGGRFIYNPLSAGLVREKAKGEIDDFPFEEERPYGEIFISVGREDYSKSFWHLLKAFSRIEKKHPHARLVIVGDGDWSNLQGLAKDLGIQDKVAFTGVRKNLFPYVGRSHIYVLSSNHEGFPNALLEGMAAGLPLIATDCKTGPREIVLSQPEYEKLIKEIPDGSSTKETILGTYGILVPDMSANPDYDASNLPDEELPLAAAMEKMLEDGELRKTLTAASLRHSADYEPAQYGADLSAILEEIARG